VDSASSQSADLVETMATPVTAAADADKATSPVQPGSAAIPRVLAEELSKEAEAKETGLSEGEFAEILVRVGLKHNFGLAPGVEADASQQEAFWRALHLRDLALAHACARGYEVAWREFLQQYRVPMQQAAMAITRSASAGEELADSLHSELFGLSEREGIRRSPLASYSGRGTLMGWLRTTLAQRHVDHHRRTYRENPLEGVDLPAATGDVRPDPRTLVHLSSALRATLRALSAEDRFLLSAYFLDGRILAELAAVLRVHEATVSRRIKRLTGNVHRKLLKQLEAGGMSRNAAREALGTDPRDLSLNLRNLLQSSVESAFSNQAAETGEKPT
jgi:RNA polymerase sigma-70 factor (ECF subfamily)